MLAAVDRGMPRKEEVVSAFGVSPATLKRWLRRRRETGLVAPKKRLGMRPRISGADERCTLWRQLEAHPEATLWRSTANFGSGSAACAFRSPP